MTYYNIPTGPEDFYNVHGGTQIHLSPTLPSRQPIIMGPRIPRARGTSALSKHRWGITRPVGQAGAGWSGGSALVRSGGFGGLPIYCIRHVWPYDRCRRSILAQPINLNEFCSSSRQESKKAILNYRGGVLIRVPFSGRQSGGDEA